MLSKSRVSVYLTVLLISISWNSLVFSQDESIPREPYSLTPDVQFSPAVRIYHFNEDFGTEDGKYYLNFDLTIPKDGNYRVTTFSAMTGADDTDTVLRNYGIGGYSGEPDEENDNYNVNDLFSQIEYSLNGCLEGEKYYFRVLPNDASQNDRSFGICYECKEITEPKKFLIGMYTMDFDNPYFIESGSYNPPSSYLNFNPTPIGHEDLYYQTLKEDNFNFIIPWFQLSKPGMPIIPATYPNRGFLDRALANGIDVIITAPMVNYYHFKCDNTYGGDYSIIDNIDWVVPFNQDVCEQTVEYFDGHPAVVGYHVMDEPHFKIDDEDGMDARTFDFDRIAAANNVISMKSRKPNYIDLKSMYPPKVYFWSGVYHEYFGYYTNEEYINEQLDPFINRCNLDYLTTEYYIFWSGKNGDSAKVHLFKNYHLLAYRATQLNKDFMPVLCLNSETIPNNIPLTPKEFDYTVYACLFNGAHGFSYWAREWITSNPTDRYLQVNMWDLHVPEATKLHLRELHGKILSKSDILVDLQYHNSFHYSAQSTIWTDYNEELPAECLWSEFPKDLTAQKYFDLDEIFTLTSDTSSPIENLAISFLTDSEGSDYFWIFNKNYSNDAGIDFQINFSNLVNLTDVFSGENSDCVCKDVRLNACEAKLFKINRSFEINGIVKIPTGFKLSIKSGELLTFLNGSELIVEEGGNLIIEEDAIIQINGNAKITGIVNNIMGRIAVTDNSKLAIGAGSNIALRYIPVSSVILGNNSELEVESGATLNYGPSTITDCGLGSRITVLGEGTLIAGEYSKFNSSFGWEGIVAEVGSTISTYSATISNAEWGINAQAAAVRLIHTYFSDCENGVWLVNCSNYYLNDNTFDGKGTGTGVRATESTGELRSNTILNHTAGIVAISCSPLITENYLHDNATCGIALYGYNTYPLLSSSSTNIELNNNIINNGLTTTGENGCQIFMMYRANAYLSGGYNNIYSGNENSIPAVPCIKTVSDIGVNQQKSEVSQLVRIPAESNYWGINEITDENRSSFFELWRELLKGYSIDYDPYAISAYEPGLPRPPHYSTNEPPTQEEQLLNVAMLLEEKGNYTASIKKYEKIIEDYPNSDEYYIAFSRLPQILAKEEESLEALYVTYDEALASDEITNKKFIKQMKVSTKIKDKKYDEAIILAEELKTETESEAEKDLCDIEIAICNMMKNSQNKNNKNGANELTNLNQLVGELIINVKSEPTDITQDILPSETKLFQNYPNPFNPVTQIKFALAKTAEVKLSVYNINGQQVAELANGSKQAGVHTVGFDGSRFNSGVYYYTLEVDGKSLTQKMILMK